MTAMRQVPEANEPTKQGSSAELSIAPAGVDVEFAAPLPGFPDERLFTLTVINEQSLLFTLRSVRNPALRFILLAPGQFFADYLPSIHENDVKPLGLVDDDEVQLFVLVTVRDSIADATANLMAPIVFVPGRNQAMQVLLPDASLPLRAPLLPVAS